MKYKSENQVMKKLDINSLVDISSEKAGEFISLLPEMDKDLAIKIIEQFPEFRQFAKEAFELLKKEYELSLEANTQSQTKALEIYSNIQKILENELERDELTFEQRKDIITLLIDVADKSANLDSRNKDFIFGLQKMHIQAISTVVVIGVLFLGNKLIDRSTYDKDEK